MATGYALQFALFRSATHRDVGEAGVNAAENTLHRFVMNARSFPTATAPRLPALSPRDRPPGLPTNRRLGARKCAARRPNRGASRADGVTDRRSPIPDLTATSEFAGNAVFDPDHQTRRMKINALNPSAYRLIVLISR